MADFFDELQGAELLASFEAAEADDFQGRLGPARRDRLPDLAEAAAPQEALQPVARPRDGLVALGVTVSHDFVPITLGM